MAISVLRASVVTEPHCLPRAPETSSPHVHRSRHAETKTTSFGSKLFKAEIVPMHMSESLVLGGFGRVHDGT